MNEEQRTVLAAVARLEESRSGPIDEYTVARGSGILGAELSGQEWTQSAERDRIRQVLDELEERGLLRVERDGYWRPRTALAGRRALQEPDAPARPAPRGAVPAGGVIARGDHEPPADTPAARGTRGWPAWWPAALRFGEPSTAPLLAAIGVVAALLLLTLLTIGVLRSSGAAQEASATGTAGAGAAATGTPQTGSGANILPPTPAGTLATATDPTAAPTPSPSPRPPTPTPAPSGSFLRIVNTNNEGAFLYVTPAGERRFALSEGTELEDLGADEEDSQGRVWKHVRYANFEGWLLEEYTEVVEE